MQRGRTNCASRRSCVRWCSSSDKRARVARCALVRSAISARHAVAVDAPAFGVEVLLRRAQRALAALQGKDAARRHFAHERRLDESQPRKAQRSDPVESALWQSSAGGYGALAAANLSISVAATKL